MRGTTVLAAAIFLVAAPLGAQEYVWNDDRPDGVAPVGIANDRTLPAGTIELGYRFGHVDARGLRFGEVQVEETDVLDLGFTFVPLSRTVNAHMVTAGLGITDAFTVTGTAGFVTKTRETANADLFFVNESSGIADIEVDALYELYRQGPYRGHVQMGVLIPLGATDAEGDFGPDAGVLLPYDMQIGTGSWALMPGVTGQVMNEFGSVGGQLRGVFSLMDNDRGYRPGTRVEGRLWMAYRFNDFVSLSAGVRGVTADPIQGFDADLETLRDPGDLALGFGTQRVDLPLGVNLRLPAGPLAGQRISAEAVWTVHEQTDGPQLGGNWGLVLGWQGAFDFSTIWPL